MDNHRRQNLRMTRLLVAVLLIVACGLMGWCFWGAWGPGIWLQLLPAPPGIVPETEDVNSGTMLTFDWIRSYDVNQPLDEVVDFFKDEMPKRGWKLVEESPYDGTVDLVFKGFFPWSRSIRTYILKLGPRRTFVRVYPHAD